MAEGMDEFVPRPGTDLQEIGFERVITVGASSPTDPVYCAPVADPTLEDGPCRWSPRLDLDAEDNLIITYPSRGDLCLYVESDEAGHWILEWWPYGG
jgi:hypothetical protein